MFPPKPTFQQPLWLLQQLLILSWKPCQGKGLMTFKILIKYQFLLERQRLNLGSIQSLRIRWRQYYNPYFCREFPGQEQWCGILGMTFDLPCKFNFTIDQWTSNHTTIAWNPSCVGACNKIWKWRVHFNCKPCQSFSGTFVFISGVNCSFWDQELLHQIAKHLSKKWVLVGCFRGTAKHVKRSHFLGINFDHKNSHSKQCFSWYRNFVGCIWWCPIIARL